MLKGDTVNEVADQYQQLCVYQVLRYQAFKCWDEKSVPRERSSPGFHKHSGFLSISFFNYFFFFGPHYVAPTSTQTHTDTQRAVLTACFICKDVKASLLSLVKYCSAACSVWLLVLLWQWEYPGWLWKSRRVRDLCRRRLVVLIW